MQLGIELTTRLPLLAANSAFELHRSSQIYNISYDNLTIMPKLQSTYDGRLIYKTCHKESKAFLWYDSLAKSQDRLRQC